jgi:hypothetical protein
MYHAGVRSGAALLLLLLLSPALSACETPRERACRSLALQAQDAEATRAAVTPDPRIAAYRAESVARWIRSNAVEDRLLRDDAAALAAALDRLADARQRLATGRAVLGAKDVADLVARADRILGYTQLVEEARASRCRENTGMTLSQQAERCSVFVAAIAEGAATEAEGRHIAEEMRALAVWAMTLPECDVDETMAQARDTAAAVADRGRADADVTRFAASLREKCGP